MKRPTSASTACFKNGLESMSQHGESFTRCPRRSWLIVRTYREQLYIAWRLAILLWGSRRFWVYAAYWGS